MVLLQPTLVDFRRPQIMGILNCTPDSFSGDGLLLNGKDVLSDRIQQIFLEGGDIIDVGAESTAPGSSHVDVDTEIQRLQPVWEIVAERRESHQKFSIDTVNSKTAELAITSGFQIVNDVSGGRGDTNMFALLAEHPNTQYVMMFCKNKTGRADLDTATDPWQANGNPIETIQRFFEQQLNRAISAGMSQSQIILDPGMGAFISTNAEDSCTVLANLNKLKTHFSRPLLIGTSRKGFLKHFAMTDNGPKSRLGAALGTVLWAAIQGVDIVRVHDVDQTCAFLNVVKRLGPRKN
eukprot:TRINITY_DN57163_c0_g1_i1.p1 TRINITY_DN57163_c0_g1~~TRINITY_DN57163_c0_g1_i1.p1  ORF type:complete len:293 (+),score=10.62 TRINITY_DN57163_c0_g1_i1:39-917(+)